MMVENPNTTQEGLPIVSPSTLDSFLQELSHKMTMNFGQYQSDISEGIRRIDATNPEVSRYMIAASRSTTPDFREFAFQIMWGVYEILRRQAEANQMEKQFGAKSSTE